MRVDHKPKLDTYAADNVLKNYFVMKIKNYIFSVQKKKYSEYVFEYFLRKAF